VTKLCLGLLFIAASLPAQLTDTDLHFEPAEAPILPGAGRTFTEPTFGTTVMQVTDVNDGKYCFNSYSYWPVFNSDNTLIVYTCTSDNSTFHYWVAEFNPTTFTLGARHEFPNNCGGDAVWSYTVPNEMYCASKGFLKKMTINRTDWTATMTPVFNVVGAHPKRWPVQIHLSRDNNRISYDTLLTEDPWTRLGTGVYDIAQGREIFYTEDPSVTRGIDESQISADGTYDVVKADTSHIVRLSDNTITVGSNTGHSDAGTTFVSHFIECADSWGNSHLCVAKRSYTPWSTLTRLMDIGSWPGGEWGLSMLAGDSRVFVNVCCTHPQSKNWENELFSIPTSGLGYPEASGQVQRYAHTYSHPSAAKGLNYFAYSMHAAVSYDGRYIAFPSTWGNVNRIMLFIVSIAPVESPTSDDYGFPGPDRHRRPIAPRPSRTE
jgi:hypothetical protein